MKHLKHLFILTIITLFAMAISPVDKAVQAVTQESASTDSEVSFSINYKANTLARTSDDTDVFGYTRSGPVTNNWINTNGGTDTGIDCDTVKSTGAIPLASPLIITSSAIPNSIFLVTGTYHSATPILKGPSQVPFPPLKHRMM